MSDEFEKTLHSIVREYSDSCERDIIIYSGPLERPYDDQTIRCFSTPRYKDALLFLTTYGGSAHAAYRIARRLQKCYDSFGVLVNTYCKSAGTLLALGAHEIIMSDYAEIGPLDVQLFKVDEIGERSSGLAMTHSLSTLQAEAFSAFEEYFLDLRRKSNFQITTKSAAEIAANLSIGLFTPIYSQIDPLRLAEIDRAVRISLEYGTRIGKVNLKPHSLGKLVGGYPDHNFVIDRTEARELFYRVRKPNEIELKLSEHLDPFIQNSLENNDIFVVNLTEDFFNKNQERQERRGGEADAESCHPNFEHISGEQEESQEANNPNSQTEEGGSQAEHKN